MTPADTPPDVWEIAEAALAAYTGPVLVLPACPDQQHNDTTEAHPFGPGARYTDPAPPPLDPDPLLAAALAIPDLPDDVRDQLTARITPPTPTHWCTYPHDVRAHVLTGTPRGPARANQPATAVRAILIDGRTLVGWVLHTITATQAAALRTQEPALTS